MNIQKLVGPLVASALGALFVISPLAAQGLGGTANTDTENKAPETQETQDSDAPAKTDKPAKIDKSRLPPVSTYQAMLNANKKSGWVSFRNFNGKQLIYFTALQTMHCRLKEIRYSINSKDLDQRFDLVKCNPYLPFSLPSNSGLKDVLISLPPGDAETVAVQVVWEDDRESEVMVYMPCPGVGEATCATTAE